MATKFVTKDSGDRKQFAGGMQRDTENTKTRWDLIPNELFDLCFVNDGNGAFISSFRAWQVDGTKPESVIHELIKLEGNTEDFFKRVAELMMRGAEKYDEWNWQKGKTQDVYERYLRSADRHFKQYLLGDKSEDHATAIFFNINGALYVKQFISL